MSLRRDSWDNCYALAERLKQQSLNPSASGGDAAKEAVQATQEAIADLLRRADQLRQQYR